MKSVILMGKGDLAVKVADWFKGSVDYKLAAIVPNMPESSWTVSLKSWGEQNNVPIIASGKTEDIEAVLGTDYHVDLAVSVTYDRIIKDWFIKRCGKIINIHNGPLPYFRGVNPINWALKRGERSHGVTIHEITPGIDDGPIIAQIAFPINPEVDEVIDVYERSLHYGWKLFKETMSNLWQIIPQPQIESEARYYSAKDFPYLMERSYFTRRESIAKLNLPDGVEKKKIRLALMSYVFDNRPNKGTAKYTIELIEELLLDPQYEITLVHYEKNNHPLYKRCREVVMPKLPFRLPRGEQFISLLLFYWKYRKDKFDVVHWFQPRVYPFYWLAPAKKIVITMHAGGEYTAASKKFIGNEIFKFTLTYLNRWVDAVIAVSEFGKWEINKYYNIPNEKIFVTYNGGGDKYKPLGKEESLAVISQKYGLAAPYILDLSRLIPFKNVKRLIEAYDLLRSKYGHKCQLVNVGSKVYDYEETLAAAKNSPYSADIKLIDFIAEEDLNRLYAAAEIFVFPSLNEGFGLPVIEAMSSGCPVVTSKTSSLGEISGDAALCVDPESVEEIAEAMHRIISDDSLKQDLVKKGLAQSVKFIWSQTAKETKEIYKKIL